jgi:hypothetical protein
MHRAWKVTFLLQALDYLYGFTLRFFSSEHLHIILDVTFNYNRKKIKKKKKGRKLPPKFGQFFLDNSIDQEERENVKYILNFRRWKIVR